MKTESKSVSVTRSRTRCIMIKEPGSWALAQAAGSKINLDEIKIYRIWKPMKSKVRPLKIIIFRSIQEMISFLDNFVTVTFKDGDRESSNFRTVSPGTELFERGNIWTLWELNLKVECRIKSSGQISQWNIYGMGYMSLSNKQKPNKRPNRSWLSEFIIKISNCIRSKLQLLRDSMCWWSYL